MKIQVVQWSLPDWLISIVTVDRGRIMGQLVLKLYMTSIECNVHTARLTVSKNTVFLHKEKMLKIRWNSKDLWNRHIFVLKFLALQLFLLIYINRRDMSSVSLESVIHREREGTPISPILSLFYLYGDYYMHAHSFYFISHIKQIWSSYVIIFEIKRRKMEYEEKGAAARVKCHRFNSLILKGLYVNLKKNWSFTRNLKYFKTQIVKKTDKIQKYNAPAWFKPVGTNPFDYTWVSLIFEFFDD